MTKEKIKTIPILIEEKVIKLSVNVLWDKIEAFRKNHSDEETLQEVKINTMEYIEVGEET